MGRIGEGDRTFPLTADPKTIGELIAHEFAVLDSFPRERPEAKPGQILEPGQIKVGITYEDQQGRPVEVLTTPYRHERLGLSVDILGQAPQGEEAIRQTASLADLGVIPYGNGRWNPHHYLRIAQPKTP